MKWLKFETEMKKRIRELNFDDFNCIMKLEYKLIFMRILENSQGTETSFNVAIRLIEFINKLK